MEINSDYPIPALAVTKANTYLFAATYKKLSNRIIALEPRHQWGNYAECSKWDDHYINGFFFITLNMEYI